MSIPDLTGQAFGRWTVVSRAEKSPTCRASRWNCKCSCGTSRAVFGGGLKSGESKSCGCLKREFSRSQCITRNTIHGDSGSKEHNAWKGMLSRCYNKRGEHYHLYGGRGIQVKDAWKDSYSSFLTDMGRAPDTENTWTVGRVDNNADYGADNCQWEVWTEQARNRGMLVNNTSGYTGVYRHVKANGRGLGNYVASWHDLSGKRCSKNFSIFRYGEDAAKGLAVGHRAAAIDEMNSKGAGYSEIHGIKRTVKELA